MSNEREPSPEARIAAERMRLQLGWLPPSSEDVSTAIAQVVLADHKIAMAFDAFAAKAVAASRIQVARAAIAALPTPSDEALAREVERRREAEARLTWRPIATAPRDKTMVALLLRSGSYTRYGIGWWNVHDWVGWLGENNPTHWASLPNVLADRQGGSPNG